MAIDEDDDLHSRRVAAAADTLLGIRDQVRAGQEHQAEMMLLRCSKYFPPVEIGDFVRLPLPTVDRGVSDPPNLICRIVDHDVEYDVYELCCKVGVLEDLYARNAFDKIESSTGLDVDMVLDQTVKLREAIKHTSVAGGQGMLLCNCKKGTCSKGTKCKCFINNLLCNSRCHGRETNANCKNL